MIEVEIIEVEYNPNDELGGYEFNPEYEKSDNNED